MNGTVTKHYDAKTVTHWLDGMLTPLMKLIDADTPAALVGIRRGGVNVGNYLLERLHEKHINVERELAELNIAFYRDDFSSVGLHPVVGPSHVPFDIENKHVVLVDDVIGTGRTIRAAMNEIFDYGRPARITLAVLVQRAGHELPIRADVVGQNLDVEATQYIVLDPTTMQVRVGDKP